MNRLRNSNQWNFRQLSILLPLCLCLAGCHSTGYRKGDAASRSLQKAAAEVRSETQEIEATLAALNDLITTPAADLKPQFQRYNAALKRLVESAEQTDRTREHMEEKSVEYFDAWDKRVTAINFGKIRDQSETRKAEVTNHFHSVNARYLDAQAVVWPLITYFTDIRTALSVDLTEGGLQSVKDIVSNADRNARKVQTALGRLADELNASSASLSSVIPRETPSSSDEQQTAVKVRSAE